MLYGSRYRGETFHVPPKGDPDDDSTVPCVRHLANRRTYFITTSGEAWRIDDIHVLDEEVRKTTPIGAALAQSRGS